MISNKAVRRYFRKYESNKNLVRKLGDSDFLLRESEEKYVEISDKIELAKKEIIIRDLLYMQLNEEEREIIDMIFIDKMSVIDIVDQIYISQSTYYRMIRKIYGKLAKYLDEFKDILK